MHRVGQRFPQRAYRLFQDHTVCRYLHYNNFKKVMPQIVAQYRDELQDLVDKRLEGADEQLEGNELENFMAFTINKVCETKLNQMMGLNPSSSPCIASIPSFRIPMSLSSPALSSPWLTRSTLCSMGTT